MGRYVNEEGLQMIQYLQNSAEFKYEDCKRELEKMKTEILTNNISLFNVLSKNTNSGLHPEFKFDRKIYINRF